MIIWSFKLRKIAFFVILFILSLIIILGTRQSNLVFSPVSTGTIPLYQANSGRQEIAFTFNCDNGTSNIPELLELLQKKGIRGTFFVTGKWVEKNPEMTRLIYKEGHELGNNAYMSKCLNVMNEEQINREISHTGKLIKEVTGEEPHLFRPPSGEFNSKVLKVAAENRYYTILWNIDSTDWLEPGVNTIVSKVNSRASKGAIILFSANIRQSLYALQKIIPYLKRKEIRCVTVSQLISREVIKANLQNNLGD